VAYRVFLGLAQRDHHPTFTVDSGSIYEFDLHFGFRYVASSVIYRIGVVDGYPTTIDTVRVNTLGNLGREPEDWRDAEFQIMVFGDSFTANPARGGIGWPDYLPGKLESATGMKTEVINFGRDGYGVLQMLDHAAFMIPNGRPSLAIIAMIADDLPRARTWRSTRRIDGDTRVLISIEPDPDPDPRSCVDRGIVHSGATASWFASMTSEHRPHDPTLREVLEQHHRLLRANLNLDLLALRTSFLLDRIRFGDPYHSVYKPSRNPRIPLTDLSQDAGFLECVEVVRQTDVPVILVLLPTLNDLKHHNYVVDSQERELLASLRKTMGLNTVKLRQFIRVPEEEWSTLYLAGDGHPSARGAEVFAEAITEWITTALAQNREKSEADP